MDLFSSGTRYKLFFVACLCFSIFSVAADGLSLPKPKELEPDINFWIRVYTEITSDYGYIHDDRHLNIVYGLVKLDSKLNKRKRKRIVKRLKKHYKNILIKLSHIKNPESLSDEELRVLQLWPENTSAKEFRAAAKRLRFQLGQSDRFKAGLVRSGKWLPYIKQMLQEHGVPLELAALPHVESSFNPSAYSFVGAAGMWQFTRSTGRRYMRIDHVIDERLDPYLSTVAAARLLKHNYETTGTWPLGITAYNHGVSGMRRAIEKTGGTNVVKILRTYDGRTFGFASRNFYVAFLAAVEVSQNAKQYFGDVEKDKPEAFEYIKLPDYISVKVIAEKLNEKVSTLRSLNPALRPPVFEGTKYIPRGFELRLPKHNKSNEAQSIIAAIPPDKRFTQQMPDLKYKVRRGDTLSQIADRFGIGLSKLVSFNNLKSRHRIRVGQVLRLPARGNLPLSMAQVNASIKGDYYIVRRGDTVSLIAKRLGVSEDLLVAANGLHDRNAIYKGQKLLIANLEKSVPTQKPVEIQLAKAEIVATDVALEKISDSNNTLAASESINTQENDIDVTFFEIPAEAEFRSLASDKIETAEPINREEADLISPIEPTGLHPALSADPSDYTVQRSNKIIVQAAETLGHYADWLEIPTQRLRNINRIKRNKPVIIGNKIKLDFSMVSKESFEYRRIEFHRKLQEEYFKEFKIVGTVDHIIKKGDLIWSLSQTKYNVPIWLLVQYNPDLNLKRIRPGDKLVFPVISRP